VPANSVEVGAPFFTVITATFNAGALFDRTFASIAAQTWRNFEWIVIDGGSREDTVARIRAARHLITYWQSEPDRGIADAWNKGLEIARGQHILFLNAGDTYDADFLQAVASVADGQKVVCCHVRLRSESGVLVGRARAEPHRLGHAMHLPHNWCAVPARHYAELGPYALLPQAMDFEWFHRYYRKYGSDGFRVIDGWHGDYHLGGTSDINYAESYRAKERIIVAHGGNPLVARLMRWAYTINHAVRRPRA
jgi:glycosyltransferase involved in cell wall biosynthesis